MDPDKNVLPYAPPPHPPRLPRGSISCISSAVAIFVLILLGLVSTARPEGPVTLAVFLGPCVALPLLLTAIICAAVARRRLPTRPDALTLAWVLILVQIAIWIVAMFLK